LVNAVLRICSKKYLGRPISSRRIPAAILIQFAVSNPSEDKSMTASYKTLGSSPTLSALAIILAPLVLEE
jgi:hypothetical protein